jgi:predicted RNA-binding Zn-ribbon protein involved in translation (DUF1610 family)
MSDDAELTVCPRCGSLKISAVKQLKPWLSRDGAIMGVYFCPDCGYEGPPFILNNREEHRKLLGQMRRRKART